MADVHYHFGGSHSETCVFRVRLALCSTASRLYRSGHRRWLIRCR